MLQGGHGSDMDARGVLGSGKGGGGQGEGNCSCYQATSFSSVSAGSEQPNKGFLEEKAKFQKACEGRKLEAPSRSSRVPYRHTPGHPVRMGRVTLELSTGDEPQP